MLKNIQKKLLLNYPLLWNAKVIPMGLTVIGFNILFFLFGLISGNISFEDNYSYQKEESTTILFLITGLTSVLVLIVWLVYYLKNNAFKSFYPKKTNSLYVEWGITFILISGNCLYSFSYLQGIEVKERSYASEQEVVKVRNLLDKVAVLLPESDSYYYTRHKETETINADSIVIKDSVSISLLNYSYYAQDTLTSYQVKKWLSEGKRDSIRNLISQYLILQERHKLTTNLNVDTWMKLIYQPPHFPVNSSNYIQRYKSERPHNYYVEYDRLNNGYRNIYKAHFNQESTRNHILITLYISLSLSILLFSFRVTSGKSWLIATVTAGLLSFINGIFSAIFGILSKNGDDIIYLIAFYWSAIFLIMILYTGSKISNKEAKSKSAIILNLILWMLPFLPMLYYVCYMAFSRPQYSFDGTTVINYSPLYVFFDENPSAFFWINLIFVIIILFFLSKIIKKWRALPEE